MTNRTSLVEQNLGLAKVIAFDYANIPGIAVSDAVSEANAALLRAAEGFDSARGEFTPYAARVIRRPHLALRQIASPGAPLPKIPR